MKDELLATIDLVHALERKHRFAAGMAWSHPNIQRAWGYAEAAQRLKRRLHKLLAYREEEE